MNNRSYIAYLNSLHNYNAQNSNAYGEKNVRNEFFEKVAVKVDLCSYIERRLKNEEPHVLILTGHAGDGKTSIMYQVLKDFEVEFNTEEKIQEICLPSKKICRCIKDYSELSDEKKLDTLKECLELPEKGQYAFMVSNTGPLINTFGELFDTEEEKENAKLDLIDAMDENSGNRKDIKGYKLGIINMASIDNTNFAVEFVKKIINESLWKSCLECKKREYCHIYSNRNLIVQNRQRVLEFIREHYIWLIEHGTRLTIRSMTEQLAYMITGGMECEDVISIEKYKLLFFNLFFGYIGLKDNEKANNILAVKKAKQCGYDKKRLRADEKLTIDCDYKVLFSEEIGTIVIETYKKDGNISGWIEFLRRAYIFSNIETDSEKKSRDTEDIFSKQFERYLRLRDGKLSPSKSDTNLVMDALSMMYLGKGAGNVTKNIPITLNKAFGVTQNVQLVTGSIPTRRMNLVQLETKDSVFDGDHKRYELKLRIGKQTLDSVISLPLLDYFEELRNGVISTNIDPQLSHGVESLKAQLTREYMDEDDDVIGMIILRNNESIECQLEITDDRKIHSV